MFPQARREEVNAIKNQIKEYQDAKERKFFIKRRVKLIKNGWRNGIVGVEMPNEESTDQSIFYKSNAGDLKKFEYRTNIRRDSK